MPKPRPPKEGSRNYIETVPPTPGKGVIAAPPDAGRYVLYICNMGDMKSQMAAKEDPEGLYYIGGMSTLGGMLQLAEEIKLKKRIQAAEELFSSVREVIVLGSSVAAHQNPVVQWIRRHAKKVEVRVVQDPFQQKLSETTAGRLPLEDRLAKYPGD